MRAFVSSKIRKRLTRLAHSIRFRFLLLGVLVVGLCLYLLIGVWAPKLSRVFHDLEIAQTRGQVEMLGNALVPYLIQNQIGATYEMLNEAQRQYPVWSKVTLYDDAGHRLYPLSDPNVQTDRLDEINQPILFGNREIGRLIILLDADQRFSALRDQLLLLSLALGASILGLILVLLFVLDRTVFHRAAGLITVSRKLAQGDYTAKLPSPGKDEIGQLVESFAAMRTTIHSKEKSLIHARRTAENAVEAKSRFLATMSHEIRTPLNGILPVTELLLESDLNSEQRNLVQIIKNAGRTLSTVIEDILDISKLEAGEVLIRKEPFALAEIVEATLSVLRIQAEDRGIWLVIKIDEAAHGKFIGDANRLCQVLLNLVGNAIKFTDKGQITVKVASWQPRRGPPRIRFSVRDTGIGISPEDQAKIFSRFSQVDSERNRKFNGTGLGLAISAGLVEAMGGKLRVESQLGKGSRFHFSLPLETALDKARQNSPDRVARPNLSRLVNPRILVVDDSKVNLKVAQSMIRRMGHDTDIASSGAEALVKHRAQAYDLIFMDLHMPDMDGLETTKVIRAMPPPQSLATISGLTASTLAEDIGRCLESGMNDFVAKPITRDEISRVIEEVSAALSPSTTRRAI
ncbi:MAG: ATP-binding protein [Mangrovicoccus sp.]